MPKVCNSNHTLHAVQTAARIRQFSAWVAEEPPALEYDEQGEILLSNELFAWISKTGACCNWLFAGDAQSMALAYAEIRKADTQFYDILHKLDKRGRGLFADLLRSITSGKASIEDACAEFERGLNSPV